MLFFFFFFSSRRRHTRADRDWSSDVCSSDLRQRPRSCLIRALFFDVETEGQPPAETELRSMEPRALNVAEQPLQPDVRQNEPAPATSIRSEEHTSELQSRSDLVC